MNTLPPSSPDPSGRHRRRGAAKVAIAVGGSVLLAAGSLVFGMTSATADIHMADTHTAASHMQLVEPAAKSTPRPTAQTANNAAAQGTALALLETLPVKGRAPKTGYTRAQFGKTWADVDKNSCDTRNDVLARDLVAVTKKGSCTVLRGTLNDPYTGKTIQFVRGVGTSNRVQIDHVVALSDAWQKGAQKLSANQRLQLANDPLNLLAVDGAINQAKGGGDAATWLMPNKQYRCSYVARQVSVKAKYALWVSQAEHDAIARVLTTCQEQPTLNGAAPVQPAPVEPAPAPAQPAPVPLVPAPAPAAPEPAPAPQDSNVYYQNCAAVRAAGKAPLHVGDPGYARKLDRDGDGIACE